MICNKKVAKYANVSPYKTIQQFTIAKFAKLYIIPVHDLAIFTAIFILGNTFLGWVGMPCCCAGAFPGK
jgi:hypothetical protein